MTILLSVDTFGIAKADTEAVNTLSAPKLIAKVPVFTVFTVFTSTSETSAAYHWTVIFHFDRQGK